MSDRIGRVRTAGPCVLIHSIFSGLIAFAPSAAWLAGLRFCGALSMGATRTAGAALVGETWWRRPGGGDLVGETWGPRLRGRGSAFMQMGLPLGAMLAIAASAVVRASGGIEHGGWRSLYLIGVPPALILLPSPG